MQLEDLKIFVATVDARNFTAAANRLQLSKQFVSRRVMALEASLGVRLLVRNTRKLAVTDLGYEFYERAARILADVADAEQAMSARRSDPRGLLRVSAPLSFGMVHLSPLVAAFLRASPEVRIDIELSDRMVDVVGEGFDMALRIGTLADSTLVAQRLAGIRMVACCSPAYRKARRATSYASGTGASRVSSVWPGGAGRLGLRDRRCSADSRSAWAASREQRRSDPRCGARRARHCVAAGIHRVRRACERATGRGARFVRIAAADAVRGVPAAPRKLRDDTCVHGVPA